MKLIKTEEAKSFLKSYDNFAESLRRQYAKIPQVCKLIRAIAKEQRERLKAWQSMDDENDDRDCFSVFDEKETECLIRSFAGLCTKRSVFKDMTEFHHCKTEEEMDLSLKRMHDDTQSTLIEAKKLVNDFCRIVNHSEQHPTFPKTVKVLKTIRAKRVVGSGSIYGDKGLRILVVY